MHTVRLYLYVFVVNVYMDESPFRTLMLLNRIESIGGIGYILFINECVRVFCFEK